MVSSLSAHTPAWKRLGLKLKNSNDSGEPVLPLLESQESVRNQIDVNAGGVHHDTSGAFVQDDEPSTLGKRKLDVDSAENGELPKGTKLAWPQNSVPISTIESGQTLFSSREATSGPISSIHPSSKEEQQLKGDPNYRKKKVKRDPNLHTNSERHEGPNRGASLGSNGVNEGLLPSTDTNDIDGHASGLSSPLKKGSELSRKLTEESGRQNASPTPPLSRRKSVTFTPDTKTTDGNTASSLFSTWETDQDGSESEFTSLQEAEFVSPPKLHPANDLPNLRASSSVNPTKAKKKKKKKKRESAASEGSKTLGPAKEQGASLRSAKSSETTPQSSQRNPAAYLSYLTTYRDSRDTWKFNKQMQISLLKKALDIEKVPPEYSLALIEYLKGLQGVGARKLLEESATSLLKNLDDTEPADDTSGKHNSPMDDPVARKAALDNALQERLTKERKRRREEAEVEALVDSSDPETHMRKLKRQRADDLLRALSVGVPFTTVTAQPPINKRQRNDIQQGKSTMSSVSRAKKSKQRTTLSDDKSSTSESSTNESSSSEDETSSSSDEETAAAGIPVTSDDDETSSSAGSSSTEESSDTESEKESSSSESAEESSSEDNGSEQNSNDDDSSDSN